MERDIVIFGAGEVGAKAYSFVKEEIRCGNIFFCDNNSEKWGEVYLDAVILSPEELLRKIESGDRVDIIVAVGKIVDEIAGQLLRMGILRECIYAYDRCDEKIKKCEDIYGKIEYSQDGEESYLKQKFAQKEEGVFVDVGANHPFLYSNTFWASKRGWRGINIEPDEINFKKLCMFRVNDINLQIGIGSKEDVLTFYRFSRHQSNTFDKNRALEVSKRIGEEFIEEKIPVKTLQTVFDEYNIKEVDILDIDAEEMDFEVLQGIDWNKVQIECILIEQRTKNLREVMESDICSFLSTKGYEPVNKYNRTVIYEKKK